MSNRVFFNMYFEERDGISGDPVQDWTVRFEDDALGFDGNLKIRLNTFLNAIGSSLKVSDE